jgi:NAD(P)-dependent dehydrogenase (short-subunit alcohol dehydrogenase family)
MDSIEGRNILILGGGGMVGMATCRELARHRPGRLVLAARRRAKAQGAVEQLIAEQPHLSDRLFAVWGDVFMRAEWQGETDDSRAEVLQDRIKRRQAVDDILAPLGNGILRSSLLFGMITGQSPGPQEAPADIVIDCMNTATAVSYQDIYGLAQELMALADGDDPGSGWQRQVELLISSLSVPQLVRHVQILYAAMRAAGTQAYIKVGTSGTGGMGFNIPYTHGEERPSRLLMSKAAVAGAQTMLTFLLARTPDAPPMVREIKPAALIGWREIAHGEVKNRGRDIALVDCPPERAVSLDANGSAAFQGDFGIDTGEKLTGVFIDTGENGVFTADEFAAITSPGQMELITPEDIARNIVTELCGGDTGRDIIAALDGSVSGPSYRGGYQRQAALSRMRDLEDLHGRAVAYEVLGPPRLSKLLYEAHLVREIPGGFRHIVDMPPEDMSATISARIEEDADIRRRILSIGLPILLPDGKRLLRGPRIKADRAFDGWVDLTAENMRAWQQRLSALRQALLCEVDDRDGSLRERIFSSDTDPAESGEFPAPGEIVGWIFRYEEGGGRFSG